ncbi:FlgN protein [Natranaerovirga hydrolytica]|uniref:FlgN protein n=1 Tax=Natranaerovirga hydrolytica TaxID=680378 RepID=A0A4R1MLI8_9FIRM|nr:flagellar export chaperone FlgN [Natranaerovirga hydrolytica]TCK93395.1 FlgN protein [Natranaerovirga hydrolytica]
MIMNDITNYIDMLIESLKQKKDVLIQIKEQNQRQSEITKKEVFKLEEFDNTIKAKDKLIKKISVLDDGFNTIYERIRVELLGNKLKYKNKIEELKKLVSEVAELGISIQVQEEKNRQSITQSFKDKKKEIKKFKNSKASATTYYKNMNNVSKEQSFFLDKKK